MMKRLLLVAALLLSGCGATAAPAPTSTAVALNQSFTYMADFLKALSSHDLACPDYAQGQPLDGNVREMGSCPGFVAALFTIDLSKPEMKAVRGTYTMRFPYTFSDNNWVIWTDTAANAKEIAGMIGYDPITG